jgi:ABC-2 type transport system ATP-binding protein
VKLAQALVHDPPLLLLDEPTSGLDPAGRDAMLRLVAELGRDHGKSVILSTHLLADVQSVCERVVIVAGGRVRGQGTVAELCAARHDRFRVRLHGEAARFREDLEAEGVVVVEDNGQGEWRVRVPAGWTNLAFFKLADLNEVVIRSLVRDDETLEELFLRTIRADG